MDPRERSPDLGVTFTITIVCIHSCKSTTYSGNFARIPLKIKFNVDFAIKIKTALGGDHRPI